MVLFNAYGRQFYKKSCSSGPMAKITLKLNLSFENFGLIILTLRSDFNPLRFGRGHKLQHGKRHAMILVLLRIIKDKKLNVIDQYKRNKSAMYAANKRVGDALLPINCIFLSHLESVTKTSNDTDQATKTPLSSSRYELISVSLLSEEPTPTNYKWVNTDQLSLQLSTENLLTRSRKLYYDIHSLANEIAGFDTRKVRIQNLWKLKIGTGMCDGELRYFKQIRFLFHIYIIRILLRTFKHKESISATLKSV
ncbi:hypothetical protein EGR_10477 [Echinococcus granulosus]|uniref:Uncharacterized protein n=1 Tax=Echinococcus granulosus TaxID=6210 RepID=W6UME5_ECHGR|nr:hypothetical protein EGR_10477 [Echinococcus granulosus]EUB54659.1 hypothetical protein EGR_10477 [Echinococcus granulosus]